MTQKRIVIIGGGPAGLLAAIKAAESGAKVLIIEKMQRPGRKLCITGKGRCNITNVAELPDFIEHFGKNGNFLRQAFSQFFSDDLMAMLEESGLPLVKERGGRVFPQSGKAPDVLTTLQRRLSTLDVTMQTGSAVTELMVTDGAITGLRIGKDIVECETVILAAGGASYPATGSTGDGCRLAKSVGHNIVSIRPALVPLETKGHVTSRMDTLNLRNINVTMFVNGKKHKDAFGELVFTKFGLTGPVILTLSGDAVDALISKSEVILSIDLKPALNEAKLDARLLRDFTSRGNEPISSILRGLLPKEMIPICLELTKIHGPRLGSKIVAKDRKKLLNWLKNFKLEVTGYRPFKEAIVTAGGVNLKEVNPRTMESLLVKGLFITGETLDINADTGGYNLQGAFSTGWLAGKSAAE